MGSESYHEDEALLSSECKDQHRAITSLMEELEAVDWYQQRIEATSEASLAAILAHNRDEEWEHAAMLIEWLRRRTPAFERYLKSYLFSKADIAGLEKNTGNPARAAGSLGIGSLKKGASA